MGLLDGPEAQTVEIAGRALRCQVCGYTLFWHKRARLHGGIATFFGIEWTSPAHPPLRPPDAGRASRR